MQETFRLGQIAGVRVAVNRSVLVIFALIAYGLGCILCCHRSVRACRDQDIRARQPWASGRTQRHSTGVNALGGVPA